MIFDRAHAPEPDKIIRLMGLFAADPRPEKIDLGVGVFRDAQGRTPVMAAVAAAEARIMATQTTKTYVALSGDGAFRDAIARLILPADVARARIASVATPGGTGAIRQGLEALRLLAPKATIWLPDPTWPNHGAIIDTLGMTRRDFRYYDPATGRLDRAGLCADLAEVAEGDVVVLHGCCHNPTGVDPDPQDWAEIAAILSERGAMPFVDLAYLGLGGAPAHDLQGLAQLIAHCAEVLVAFSGSKSFGLYRDRVGLILALCRDASAAQEMQGLLTWLNRQNYAFPPDHGARVVQVILDDPDLTALWQEELAQMRAAIAQNRAALVAALGGGNGPFGAMADHRGMFSLSGLNGEAVARLRDEYAIYLVGDGRINLAALTDATVGRVAQAILAVTG